MPEESANNTKSEEKIISATETVEFPARQMPPTENKSANSKVETLEDSMAETDNKNSNELLPNQFKCYSCGKITEYFPQMYEEPIESETPVVAWRELHYYIKCNNCGELNRLAFMANRIKPNGVDEPPTVGKPPTIKEEFYLSLAGEFVKNNT